MKRILTCLLALVMLFQITACAADAKAPAFADVSADADYAKAVTWCAEQGLMNGVEDGTSFDPDGSMTRAMLATILYRQAGEPRMDGKPDFTDAQPNVWYSNAVTWAAEKQLLRGYGNGLFGVNDPVSKEMLNVVMARQNGKDPVWTGSPELAVDAKRSEAAVALYETFYEPEPEPTRRPSGGSSSSGGGSRPSGGGGGSVRPTATPAPTPTPTPTPAPAPESGKVLVAYFSATGNTRPVAEKVAELSGGDLFEIVPAQPYTAADLNYNTDCRANAEQNDPDARPAIANTVEDMEGYDAVLIGYPIWWGRAPKIIHTFLETYDLSGKTVATFCTSGGSGHEDATLRGYEPDATWLEGRRFSGTSQVEDWVKGLDLPKAAEEVTNKMYVQIGSAVWTASLEDNPSVAALKELLGKGPLSVDMSDYGGFEKVGGIGTSLPRTDRQITTKPGDIILYQGNSVTIYYGENTWSFTPLGHIDGVSDAELREVLKAGGDDVSVIFSLTRPQDMTAQTVILNSGYEMPALGLGTWTQNDATTQESVYEAIKAGYRLIDTAQYYGNEAGVGAGARRAIDEGIVTREELFITTKVMPTNYQNAAASITASNERLGLDYIDLMLVHQSGSHDKDAYSALEQAAKEGIVHSIGISNYYTQAEFERMIEGVEILPAVVQNENHIFYQNTQLQEYLKQYGTVLESYYPFGGRGHTSDSMNHRTIQALAQKYGKTGAQIILRWHLQAGYIAIPGSSNPEHIRENYDVFDFTLTDGEMEQIAALNTERRYENW